MRYPRSGDCPPNGKVKLRALWRDILAAKIRDKEIRQLQRNVRPRLSNQNGREFNLAGNAPAEPLALLFVDSACDSIARYIKQVLKT